MWAWRCEEALLRAPRIPELWCEMRREKAYGRGSSATNHPFHRDGHGVHPWTPAHCRAFRSLSCHFTDLRTAAWILLPWVLRSPDCGLPALRLTHLCVSVHLAAQCPTHTHAWQVYSKLSGVWHGRAPPACRCAPPSPCVDLCCIHSPIPWKRDWASCTKLFEILFHGKVITSALFRSITIWKSPSRASYGGCPFRAHGLILTYYMIETPVLLFWVQITSRISFMLQTVM